MDGKTVEQIRMQLLERWQQIGGKPWVNEIELAGDMNLQQAEIIDIAQSLEQIDRDKSLKEQERREMLAIERALAKMATGNFGICEECGEEIPAKRIHVLPEARLCANCQAFEERQQARVRAPGLVAR